MSAAVAEAKRHWPEFVAHFSHRDPAKEPPLLIKAPFGENGDEEFMWVVAEAIEDDFVRRKLANQPHHIIGLHEGQEVTVPVNSIVDWLCAGSDDEPLGGWTQKVLGTRRA